MLKISYSNDYNFINKFITYKHIAIFDIYVMNFWGTILGEANAQIGVYEISNEAMTYIFI